jgi:hypothetical protein
MILKIAAIRSSKTSLNFHQTTHHIPAGSPRFSFDLPPIQTIEG